MNKNVQPQPQRPYYSKHADPIAATDIRNAAAIAGSGENTN